jgi:hypothetical protein
MNELLVKIIDARGGMGRWHWDEKIEETIVAAASLRSKACRRMQTRGA